MNVDRILPAEYALRSLVYLQGVPQIEKLCISYYKQPPRYNNIMSIFYGGRL